MTCNSHLVVNQPFTHQQGRWVYGVWYCGTSWQKVKLYGPVSSTFLKRVKSLFHQFMSEETLHVPSGTLEKWEGVTVDLFYDGLENLRLISDAAFLHLKQDHLISSFQISL